MAQAVTRLWPGARYAIGPVDRGRLLLRLRAARRRALHRRGPRPASRRRCGTSSPRTSPSSAGALDRARAWRSSPTSPTSGRSSRASAPGRRRRGRRRRGRGADRRQHLPEPPTPFIDLCRGPHVPSTKGSAIQADQVAGGLLAGRREAPAAAADLRHGVGVGGGPGRLPAPAWRRPSGATTASSGVELDLFSFPAEIGRGLAVFHPKGGTVRKLMEDYSRQRHERGRLRVRLLRRTSPSRRCSRSRATWTGTPTPCTRPWRWTGATTTSSP